MIISLSFIKSGSLSIINYIKSKNLMVLVALEIGTFEQPFD